VFLGLARRRPVRLVARSGGLLLVGLVIMIARTSRFGTAVDGAGAQGIGFVVGSRGHRGGVGLLLRGRTPGPGSRLVLRFSPGPVTPVVTWVLPEEGGRRLVVVGAAVAGCPSATPATVGFFLARPGIAPWERFWGARVERLLLFLAVEGPGGRRRG